MRNQRLKAPQESHQLHLADLGWVAARTRPAAMMPLGGELLDWVMSPVGRPR